MTSAVDEQYAPLAVLAVATAVVAWCIQPYLVGVFHDDGVYALLAESIARGQGFHYSNLPGAPAAIHYPPLYPLVLAAIWRVWSTFPDNVSALVMINAPLAGIAAYGWWQFATRQLQWKAWRTALAALVATLTLPTLALASALLSETLFLAMLWPALVLSEQAVEKRRSAAVAGALVGLLMLVRTHAVALLFALVVILAFDRRWRDGAIAFTTAVLVQLPWLAWSAVATPRVAAPLEGSYGSYLGWFFRGVQQGGASFLGSTIRVNAHESALYVNDRFAAGFPVAIQYLGLALLGVAIAAGLGALWLRARVTVLFIVAYVGIMLAWPYNPWRFLWAVWPLILLIAMSGVVFAWTRVPRLRVVVAVAALLPTLAMVRVEQQSYLSKAWRSSGAIATRQIAPVVGWVRVRTAPKDVILGEGEQTIALFASRLAAPPMSFTAREYLVPPTTEDATARLSEMLHSVPAQWVILLAPTSIRAADALRGRHPGLERAAELRTAVVYRVTP